MPRASLLNTWHDVSEVHGYLFKAKAKYPRGHSREVWVELCLWGLQTPTLFKTKIAHFATLFRTGDTTFWTWFVLSCLQNYVIFTLKSRRLIVKLYTLFKTQDLENHTMFSGTYPYRPNKGVPPSPPGPNTVFTLQIREFSLICDESRSLEIVSNPKEIILLNCQSDQIKAVLALS